MKKITHRQHIPYDTGKVKIGRAYIPKPRQMNQDEHVIQDLLLSKGVKQPICEAAGQFIALWVYRCLASIKKIALRGSK